MLRRIAAVAFLAAMAFVAAPKQAHAQCAGNTCTFTLNASISISSTISCAATRTLMDFGNHFKGEGHIGSTEANHLRIECAVDPQNGTVDVSFTLPSVMTRNGGTETLPIAFGSESLRLYDCATSCGTPQGSDPHTPRTFNITSGHLVAAIGENGPGLPQGEVSVDLSSATAAGTYTAQITAVVALR
jgi:hypothetical protein